MKKVAAFVALSLLMAGCVSNDKIAVTPEQLQHHRFVLESVNGKPVTSDKNPPEISFGENDDFRQHVTALAVKANCLMVN